MTDNQRQWVRTKAELVSNIERLGFPGELGEQLAKMLGSPKAMERIAFIVAHMKDVDAQELNDNEIQHA